MAFRARVPTVTADSTIGRVRIPVYELYAQPQATQKLLDDAVINVEEWLINKVSAKFSRAENSAFIVGTGVGMPRGFTTYSAQTRPTTAVPGASCILPTGVNGGFATSTRRIALRPDAPVARRLSSERRWIMPRAVADMIRKFKENTTQAYIWQPGLQQGTPATLLGFPITLGEDMPAVATGSFSLAFGNFEEGYTIVDRIGMRILRDPYTGAPFIKFRCTKRTGRRRRQLRSDQVAELLGNLTG